MYDAFLKQTGTGASGYSTLNSALQALTNFGIYKDSLHLWHTVDSNIRSSNLPGVSLRSSTSNSAAWHYRLIAGTIHEVHRTKKTFLWNTWYDYKDHYWYILRDNGADGGATNPFYEYYTKIYQLQSARVRRYKW
jgi:hypothetical protein